MNKCIREMPQSTHTALIHYPWPANVRELRNFIEWSVILSPQSVLMAPIHELEARPSIRASRIPMGTLDEVKREHILRALQASGWIVGGPNGAAELLGVKRTSLYKDAKTEYSETHPGLQ